LAAIRQRTGAIARDALEPAAVEWAWELADQSAWDRNAWLDAAAWGHDARLLMRRWWEAATTEQLGEIDDLVELPSLRQYRSALVERGACMLVGGHVGPTAAAVRTFHGGNWMFRPFGATGFGRAYGTALMAVPSSIATIRTLVNQIKSGITIGLMADTPMGRDRLAVEFLGRTVELPLLIPKLIQHYGTASFWCCPLWRGKRIVIELDHLPEPAAGEPSGAWCERWFAAYLAKLEAVMRGRPENLGLFSGIWGNVNPAALHSRQQQPSRIRRAQAELLR
jgi:lauroyl/myristoyl acyltransferase